MCGDESDNGDVVVTPTSATLGSDPVDEIEETPTEKEQ